VNHDFLGAGMTTPPAPNIGSEHVDGNDFLAWQRGLGVTTSATNGLRATAR
jgi:hypothetical protein